MARVLIQAELPDGLAQALLQHLRDFDSAHPGCHFQFAVDVPNMSFTEMMQAVKVDPPFDVEWHGTHEAAPLAAKVMGFGEKKDE